nr:ATP-binding protein [Candidatus Cloacimonadota bacterium]
SAYSSVEALLESRHHPIRNPLIVRIFRQIGLCEEAGTGIRTIMEDCRKLGLFPAHITNDKSDFSFSLSIRKQQIISEPFKDLITRLDLELNPEEAAIFSYLVCYRKLSLPIAKAITGKSSDVTLATMAKLEVEGLAKSTDHNQAWSLCESIEQQINKPGSDQAGGQATGQVSGQAQEESKHLSDIQVGIILNCTEPMSMQNLRKKLNLGSRYNLRTNHIRPLLERGILMMSFPEAPKHPQQKYYLSDYGKEVLQVIQGEH